MTTATSGFIELSKRRGEALAEAGGRVLAHDIVAPPPAHLQQRRRVAEQRARRSCELGRVEAPQDAPPARPLEQRLGAAAGGCEDGYARRQGLCGDNPESLLPRRQDEERGAAELGGDG